MHAAAALGRALACASCVLAAPASAGPSRPGVEVRERLGSRPDPGLSFVDHRGGALRLGELIGGGRPVLLSLNYFRCETLCDLQLARVAGSLRVLSDLPAEAFRMVTVSIDPRDRPSDAAAKRALYLRKLGRSELDWTFLTGGERAIGALAASLGFAFRYDARSDQYAHAPVLFVLAPDGRVARYLYGLDYPPRDLRLALVEASQGKLGTTADRVLLSCFQFEGAAGRYGPYVLGLVRAGGVLTVLGLALGFVVLRRVERRQHSGR